MSKTADALGPPHDVPSVRGQFWITAFGHRARVRSHDRTLEEFIAPTGGIDQGAKDVDNG